MLKGGGEPDLSALVDPIAVSDPWLAASRAGKRLRAVPRGDQDREAAFAIEDDLAFENVVSDNIGNAELHCVTNGPAAASSGDAPETQVGFDVMSAADQAGAIAAAVLAQLAPRLDLVETNVQAQISGLQAEIRTVAAAHGQTSGTVR